MKKLLHERLREIAPSISKACGDDWGIDELRNAMNVAYYSTYQSDLKNTVLAIADEIEKYYIPRPRFEDGEPVQFGDEIELHYKSGGCEKGRIQAWHVNKGTVWTLSFVGVDHERLYRYDSEVDVLKRPEPKVLDADGVEINVGDVVWPINNPEMKMTVDNFQRIYGQDVTVNCEFEGEFYNFNPNKLTHSEPDSLEKLRNDMAEYKTDTHFAEIKTEHTFGEFIKRLTAIMERDA